MEKLILMTSTAYDWQPVGIFDTEENMHEWIEDSWECCLEDYLRQNPSSDKHNWYVSINVKVFEVTYYG